MQDIIVLLALIFAVAFTIRPVKFSSARWKLLNHVSLDMASAPVLALIPVYISGVFSISETFDVLNKGSPSAPGLSMLQILIMFQSLAYLCLSIDETGLFRYLTELAMTSSFAGSPFALFNIVFALSSFLTIVSSNDIVIMTVTPMIYYALNPKAGSNVITDPVTRKLGLVPYLSAQFMAANTWSTIFTISNPTNLLVTIACKWTFIDYLKYMLLPSIAGGITLYLCLYFKYGRLLSRERMRVKRSSQLDLRKWPATFGTFSLLLCIVGLAALPMISPLFIVVIPASLTFVFDVICDVYSFKKQNEHSFHMGEIQQYRTAQENSSPHSWNTVKVIKRLPWVLLPFASSMFLLVLGMERTGIVQSFLQPIFPILLDSSGRFGLILGTTALASATANLINNQPMTLLWTIGCIGSTSLAGLDKKYALLSVVIASNYAGNITLIGALAGIMWMTILKDLHKKGQNEPVASIEDGVGLIPLVKETNAEDILEMSPWLFFVNGITIMPVVMLVACSILYLESMTPLFNQ